jgi:DNA-binding MarR family transcriptional regulator
MLENTDYTSRGNEGTGVRMVNGKSSVSEDERDAARVMMGALECFRAENPVMTIQLAFTFLMVVHDEGLGVTEYAAKAGITQSVMSRHIADLGEYNRRHEPGLNLVVQKVDVMDRRRTTIHLSARGKTLVAKLSRTLAGTKALKR